MKTRKRIAAVKLVGPCVWREVMEAVAYWGPRRWVWQIAGLVTLAVAIGTGLGLVGGGLVLWRMLN